MKIQKILIPVDFQDTSLRILHPAAALARHFNSEILLLHVVTPLSYFAGGFKQGEVPDSKDLLNRLFAYAEKALHESVRPELEGLNVKCLVVKGNPAREIVSVARAEEIDLIVMPTHGYGGFYRFLVGSVTAKVIHDSDCPVLTAAHLEAGHGREFVIKHVLCPVQFSDHSRRTLQWAAMIAAEFKAKLTVAHVTPSMEMYGPGGSHVDVAWRNELVKSASDQIAKLQREAGTEGEVVIEGGDPAEILNQIGKKIGADLMVVGAHAYAGKPGAKGYAIICESHIPVLSV